MSRALALLAGVALLLASCADSKSSGTDESKPKEGGTLRIGVTQLSSLDPAFAQTVDEQLVAEQLFDALTAWDTKTLEVVPQIAESWAVTPDLKQWDFVIRKDATFSNGQPVTAEDVKYTFDRIARKDSGAATAELLDVVAGFAAARDQGAPDLSGVSVPSAGVVRFTLDQPVAELNSLVGNPAFGIVPRAAVEAPAPKFAEEPVTSGPFRFHERAKGALVLRRLSAEGYVDTLEVRQYKDEDAAYRAFRDGAIDWCRLPLAAVIEAAKKPEGAHAQPYVGTLFFGLNVANPELADPRFREAIVRAIDRHGIVSDIYGGSFRTTDGLIVGVPGSVENPCGDRCTYDVAKAKALVAETFGAGAPPEVTIHHDQDPTQEQIAAAIREDLQAVGIPSRLQATAFDKEFETFLNSGAHEMVRLGWVPQYPSPDAILPALFLAGSAENITGLADAGIDSLLLAARAQPDPKLRVQQYQAAEKAILDKVVVVPLAQVQLHWVATNDVHGLVMTPMGTFDATEPWVLTE